MTQSRDGAIRLIGPSDATQLKPPGGRANGQDRT